MPAVINVGGSLTGAFAVIAVAWGIRTLRRSVSLKRRAKGEESNGTFSDLGAYFAALSPEAVRLLVSVEHAHSVSACTPAVKRSCSHCLLANLLCALMLLT